MQMPFLPEEIIFRIFLLLPAKVLHDVMRLVCRAWRKVIRDPVFTKAHLLQSPDNSPFGVFPFKNYFELYYINKDDTTLNIKKRINKKYVANGVGLILAVDSDDRSIFYLLNPITNQILTLPCTPTKFPLSSHSCAVAYSPSTSKYKVVCIDFYSKRVYIWTVGVDKDWREIIVEPDTMTLILTYTCFQMCGIWGYMYWYYSGRGGRKFVSVIDMEKEIFYNVDFLEEVEDNTRFPRSISSDQIVSMTMEQNNKCWQFWEMVDHKNGGEWRKLGSIDFKTKWSEINEITGLPGNVKCYPLLLMNRDEVIFRSCNSIPLFSYNFKSGKVSRLFRNQWYGDLMFTNSLVIL